MREVDTRRLKDVLRTNFGFIQGAGGKTGRETWVNSEGRRIHPTLRHKAAPYTSLYRIGLELEAQGVCTRAEFLGTFKS